MLAAECAWAVLKAEHSQTRQLLAEVQHRLAAPEVHDFRQRAVAALGAIHKLEAFESTVHRPKGLVLLASMRGRAADTDSLLEELESECEHCAKLLTQASALLSEAVHGEERAFSSAAQLLAEHRQVLMQHLHKEDTLLRSRTAQLLTREEWAAVASSMSHEMKVATVQLRRAKYEQAPLRR